MIKDEDLKRAAELIADDFGHPSCLDLCSDYYTAKMSTAVPDRLNLRLCKAGLSWIVPQSLSMSYQFWEYQIVTRDSSKFLTKGFRNIWDNIFDNGIWRNRHCMLDRTRHGRLISLLLEVRICVGEIQDYDSKSRRTYWLAPLWKGPTER